MDQRLKLACETTDSHACCRTIDHDDPELGGPRPRVRRGLGLRGYHCSGSNLACETVLSQVGECLLHQAILEAVEPDDRDACLRCEPARAALAGALRGAANRIEERIERSHFIVHRDAKRLEGLRRRMHPRSVGAGAVGLPNQIRKLRRRLDRRECTRSHNFRRDAARQRLLAKAGDDVGQIALAGGREELRGGHARRRVEAHVERSVAHEAEAALGVVDLRRGEAEVGEHDVGTQPARLELAANRHKAAVHGDRRAGARLRHALACELEIAAVEVDGRTCVIRARSETDDCPDVSSEWDAWDDGEMVPGEHHRAVIVVDEGREDLRDRAFTAGLVHDIGKLLLDRILARRLEWQKAVNDPKREPRNRLPTLPLLRQWQSKRLEAGFQDFLRDPSMRPAAQFFLSDLYADRDFSARDRDAAKVLPMMSRFLPDTLLRAATDAIELAVLSHAFDLRLAEYLARRPDPLRPISTADYCKAYQSAHYPRLRRHQIELVLRVGHALDAAVRKHGVYKLLKAMRVPAQMAGLSELQKFLERGFTAFDALGGADSFLDRVATQELEVSRRLFAGHPQPFAQPNSSSR